MSVSRDDNNQSDDGIDPLLRNRNTCWRDDIVVLESVPLDNVDVVKDGDINPVLQDALIYKISDTPPLHLTVFFAFQCVEQSSCTEERSLAAICVEEILCTFVLDVDSQFQTYTISKETVKTALGDVIEEDVEKTLKYTLSANVQCLVSIAGSIIACMLVAEAACALEDGVFLRKLLSSAMLMNGITTLLQNTVGIRLPVYQGPTGAYALPLIALTEMKPTRCDINLLYDRNSTDYVNKTDAELTSMLVDVRVRELYCPMARRAYVLMMGPLMLAGTFHFLIGATGLLGLLMRFIGPVTIVPTILLMGIYTVKPAMEYCESHWGLSFMTWVISLILSLYLGHKPMPIPFWRRKRGFHFIRYPLHQVFAILIAILIGWAVCGIMTSTGLLTDDRNNVEYKSRTDAKFGVIENSEWIYVPYPGHFGWPKFSMNCLIGFLIATLTSILDSLGDYFATASTCRVPPPPSHAVNRGIAIEGFCTIIAGIMGTGHGTTTYGGNIGAIGMTKVASRRVFVGLAFMYIGLSIFAKVCAVFVSIPYPVLGGSLITIVGAFVGFNLTNLQVLDLNSTRNLTIIGMAIFVGIMVPDWIKAHSDQVKTGNEVADQLILLFLGNPNFFGGFLACFLDNTVPGTEDERGISAWKAPDEKRQRSDMYLEESSIYDMPCGIQNVPCLRKLPVFRK